jgi:adenine deaminase
MSLNRAQSDAVDDVIGTTPWMSLSEGYTRQHNNCKNLIKGREINVDRRALIEAARGDRPLDLEIRNVSLVNVFTCEIYPVDIGIFGERIAVVLPVGEHELEARSTIDGTGKWAAPGFVDPHVHIESMMATPATFAAAVLPYGTTTVVIDPHEIANVMGKDGVRFMIEASEGLPLRVYVCVPSSVPAVPGKETAGAVFGPADVAEMLTWLRVVAVGEVMDYPGVIRGDPRMMGIVQAGHDARVTIQGHAPFLSGRELNAYLASGASDDHEMVLGNVTVEKLRLGMLPLMRKASGINTIPDILPGLMSMPFLELAICTDDIEPADLARAGHLDRGIREVIKHGVDPAVAIRWATLVGARQYRLWEHGAIAPGYHADIVLLSSLKEVQASEVIVGGKLVVENGELIVPIQEPPTTVRITNSVRLGSLDKDAFKLKPPVENGDVDVNVILFGEDILLRLEQTSAQVENGELQLNSVDKDAVLLSVVPRHGQSHPPSVAVMKGLGLKRGAMATTISHDCHNIIVAGKEPGDMLAAVMALKESAGGVVLVEGEKVMATVELPIAGLLSWKPVSEVAGQVERFNQAAHELGLTYPVPVLALSFLALAVIPDVRITDLGLVDVNSQEFIPVFP